MSKVLVLDPATSSGFMLLDVDEGKVVVERLGLIDLKGNETSWKLALFYDYISSFITTHNVTKIVFEEYFFSSRFCSGANLNVYIRGMLMLIAGQKCLEVITIPPSDWKKCIAGSCYPSKEQKKKWKAKAKKEYIKEALDVKWGISFPEKVDKSKGPKPKMINLKSDLIDCVGIGICYLLRDSKVSKQTPFLNVSNTKIEIEELGRGV